MPVDTVVLRAFGQHLQGRRKRVEAKERQVWHASSEAALTTKELDIRSRGSADAKKPPPHHANIAIASRSVNRLTGMLAACNLLQIKFDVRFGAFGITMLGWCSLGTPIALV